MARRSKRARWWRQRLGYPLETAVVYLFYGVLSLLPVDAASAVGGWIGRTIGPRLAASRKALRNIERALPDTTAEQRRAIVVGMWDNLGRVMAEYPHLERIWREGRVEFVGVERIRDLAASGRPALLTSGHFGNWELMAPGAAREGLPPLVVYRRPNNARVDRLLRRARGVPQAAKGRDGARAVVAALRQGRAIGMLVDQKMNDGIPVPFFGRDAMTAPAVAQLALRHDVPIFLVHIERLGGAHFRLHMPPAMELPDSGDRNADVRAIMVEINHTLEQWVRERPEQWLWLHRRWPD